MKPFPELPRMNQVEAQHLCWDLHAHSNYVDGRNSVSEMAAAAGVKGLTLLGFTEHVRSAFKEWWPQYVQEVRNHKKDGLKVVLGMEANAIGEPGNIDITRDMERDAELVLGAVHGYYTEEDWSCIPPEKLCAESALEYETEHLCGLCENPTVHVLAHPFWLYGQHFGEPPVDALQHIAHKAHACDTAIEINFRHLVRWPEFKSILQDINPFVTFGSNSHSVDELLSPQEMARRFYD